MARWHPFDYVDFHDQPRWIYTTDGQRAFVLDCPFDDVIDDYPSQYTVYSAPVRALRGTGDPVATHAPEALSPLGHIRLTRDSFDPTLRARIDWDALAPWA